MKTQLVTAWLCLAVLDTFGEPFANLSFDAATQKAAQSDKIVMVDFYTTWCGPCKMLDKITWTDAEVIKLLQQKTVALRLDAEVETNLAARYKINAYPTVLLIKPDGTEMDRLVGYRDAKMFIADFDAALSGKDSVVRAKEALAAAGANDPMARMEYAASLSQKGKDAEALEEYLWCFDHGLENNASFVGVRLSFLLGYIKDLGVRYPAAKKELENRRDERQAKVQAGSADRQTVIDLMSLNGCLDQKDRNLAVFDQLPAKSRLREIIANLIVDQLLEAKRYTDILGDRDAKVAFGKQADQFNEMLASMPKDNPMRGQLEETMRPYTATQGAHLFEALAGLKRNGEAKELAQQILEFDASAATRTILAEAADRAGNAELAQYVRHK